MAFGMELASVCRLQMLYAIIRMKTRSTFGARAAHIARLTRPEHAGTFDLEEPIVPLAPDGTLAALEGLEESKRARAGKPGRPAEEGFEISI